MDFKSKILAVSSGVLIAAGAFLILYTGTPANQNVFDQHNVAFQVTATGKNGDYAGTMAFKTINDCKITSYQNMWNLVKKSSDSYEYKNISGNQVLKIHYDNGKLVGEIHNNNTGQTVFLTNFVNQI